MRRNYTIDSFRLVASLFVVFIHAGVVNFFPPLVVISKISVPYFFAVTGYFIYKDDREKQIESLLKILKRMLKIFVFAYICMFCFSYFWANFIFPNFHLKPALWPSFTEYIFSLKNLEQIFLYTNVSGAAGFDPLWFLVASFFCLTLFLINAKFIKKDYLLAIIAAFGFLWQRLHLIFFNIQLSHSLPRWLCDAFIFIIVGYFVRKYLSLFDGFKTWKIAALALFSFWCHVVQIFPKGQFFTSFEPDYTYGSIFFIFALLIIFSRYSSFGAPINSFKGFAHYGKLVGLNIYLIHSFVWLYFVGFYITIPVVGALFAYALSFITALIYHTLKKRVKAKFQETAGILSKLKGQK